MQWEKCRYITDIEEEKLQGTLHNSFTQNTKFTFLPWLSDFFGKYYIFQNLLQAASSCQFHQNFRFIMLDPNFFIFIYQNIRLDIFTESLQHCMFKLGLQIGLIQVKEEGWTGFALGKSLRAALPARGKPRPSWLFYLALHSI